MLVSGQSVITLAFIKTDAPYFLVQILRKQHCHTKFRRRASAIVVLLMLLIIGSSGSYRILLQSWNCVSTTAYSECLPFRLLNTCA